MAWSRYLQKNGISKEVPFLVLEPEKSADLGEVLRNHKEEVEKELSSRGAVLFRGFSNSGERALNDAISALGGAPMSYTYRSTPRTSVGAGVYTATEYPAALEIPMHNENAYQRNWPMRLAFHCVQPAVTQGQTPLADTVRVTSKIDRGTLKEFSERGVRYVRNYMDRFDLPWHVVFQTKEKEEVERFCELNGIEYQWREGGLRTSQICQGTAVHPITNEQVWFNQSQLFHVTSLGSDRAADMISLFTEANLPRNAYFGDGAKIPEDTIAKISGLFESEKLIFDWKKDDLLIIDNMKISHGRRPYTGQRRVLVAMWAPFSEMGPQATNSSRLNESPHNPSERRRLA